MDSKRIAEAQKVYLDLLLRSRGLGQLSELLDLLRRQKQLSESRANRDLARSLP